LIHFWPENAIGVRAEGTADQRSHVAVTCDGSSQAARRSASERRTVTEVIRDNLYKDYRPP
jgi:hypothetical protein